MVVGVVLVRREDGERRKPLGRHTTLCLDPPGELPTQPNLELSPPPYPLCLWWLVGVKKPWPQTAQQQCPLHGMGSLPSLLLALDHAQAGERSL
jgi:hypothetical protein